ncbi:PEP-CTERM sorting domain-containing protein [Myxococcota bacterium]|nr:PEP-CTERM sorting domain-containing protein [Myxococcota bacterium]
MHRLMFSTGALALVFSVVIAGSASVSSAASYGNFTSPTGTVSFLNVADVNGLFGAPTVSGNSLDFSPSTFEASCAASPGCPPTPASVSDTLVMDIDAAAGQFIDTIVLSEAGDTTLASFLNAFAATTVSANVFIDVLEINGVTVNGLNENALMVFTRNGQYETNDEGTGTHIWTGLLSIDVNSVIAGDGGNGKATLVRISLSNTLTAFSAAGAAARIEKKDVDGLAITVIPEPGTALLLGLGLLGLASGRARSRVR